MAAKLRVAIVCTAVCCLTVAAALPYPPEDDEVQRHRPELELPEPYKFEYAVHDPSTGDVKSHNEIGDEHGGVKGSYMLVESDGSTRVVEYTADDEHGFQANVKKIGPPHQSLSVEPHEPAAPEPYHLAAPEPYHHAKPEPYHHAKPEPYHHAKPEPYHHAKPAAFRAVEYKQIVVPAVTVAAPPPSPSPSAHTTSLSAHAGQELHWYVPEVQDLQSR